MKFRPCIDLHSGQVKQIVGSTLTDDAGDKTPAETDTDLATNFATDRPASSYAEMYLKDQLTGGHVIMLGPGNTDAAKSALKAYPGGLQIGGGINSSNAREWLDAGAGHVIVTSHVFHNGQIDMERLRSLVDSIGKERLVLDLSCRRKPGDATWCTVYSNTMLCYAMLCYAILYTIYYILYTIYHILHTTYYILYIHTTYYII